MHVILIHERCSAKSHHKAYTTSIDSDQSDNSYSRIWHCTVRQLVIEGFKKYFESFFQDPKHKCACKSFSTPVIISLRLVFSHHRSNVFAQRSELGHQYRVLLHSLYTCRPYYNFELKSIRRVILQHQTIYNVLRYNHTAVTRMLCLIECCEIKVKYIY